MSEPTTTPTPASPASLERLSRTTNLGRIGHLPVWSAIEVADVAPGLQALLDQTESAFTDLEQNHAPTWDGLMLPLEALQDRLGRLLGAVVHLTSVKYTDELQAAYDSVRPRYVGLVNRMSQSRRIYEGMVALRDGAQWQTLDAVQQRILNESIRSMERSGVHLEGAPKARYKEIQERLSELSNRFQTNLVKEEKQSRIRVTDPAEVAGVPAPVLAAAAQTAVDDGVASATAEAGPWHFVVSGVTYMAVIEHAAHRGLRETFYRAFRSRGTSGDFDNRPLLEEILRLRQEQSLLLGFGNYAERSIDAKMAPSVDAVWKLLDELEQAARPAAEREYAALRAFVAEQRAGAAGDAPEAAASGAGHELAPWDLAYWTEQQREALYSYDSERLREYFQMPRVLDGLFDLIRKLYDVEIRRREPDAVPVWDPSVEFFEVVKDGAPIAGFYVDPYARPGEKRGGAWMGTVVDRSRVLAHEGLSSSLPVALFVMNGRPPAAGGPALMSLDEVRTLFHEFGHATQHMFTEVEEGGASGMNLVEWDAVELASQFNEYWMEHPPFLKAMSAHVDSGEPLDDATIGRIVASRNFMVGNATLRQLQFAKTDLALHQRYGLPIAEPADPARPNVAVNQTVFELEWEIAAQTLVLPRLPEESQLPAFGHLFSGGYAAGYYSYKWAEVLAADAFAAFREAGLDDAESLRAVAARFRETVLGLGGSLPAQEIYRQFRGRDATPDALLADQGLRD